MGKKGQPEGYIVTGKTGRLWVAEAGLVPAETAGQNNSNPTLYAASAANSEWELLLGIVPIIVFTYHIQFLTTMITKSTKGLKHFPLCSSYELCVLCG
jgi:hypothetical protein